MRDAGRAVRVGAKTFVMWRSLDDLCAAVLGYARENGLLGTVVTEYELFGEEAPIASLAGLPPDLRPTVIRGLEASGHVITFHADDGGPDVGIKFVRL